MTTQLERIQALADERAANEGLYAHQRERGDTYTTILCFLLGAGAVSDEHLMFALDLLREADARDTARRAEAAS